MKKEFNHCDQRSISVISGEGPFLAPNICRGKISGLHVTSGWFI